MIGALQNLLHYHQEAFRFHTRLHDGHTYQSWPWQWLLLGRPVAFYSATQRQLGRRAAPRRSCCSARRCCGGRSCRRWLALVWFGIARRDWRAGAILLMVAAGLLPWFYYALDGPHDVLVLHRPGRAVPGARGGLRARRADRRRRGPATPTAGWSARSRRARTWCWWRSASRTSTGLRRRAHPVRRLASRMWLGTRWNP